MTNAKGRSRHGWAWLLAGAGLVAIVVLGGRPSERVPFDPRSPESSGTKALIVLLEGLGADVTITDDLPAPEPGADMVIAVLRDRSALSASQLGAIDDALRDGATVVVTDPYSTLTPVVAGPLGDGGPFATEVTVTAGKCTIDPLSDVETLEATDALAFDTSEARASCFGDEEEAYATVTPRQGGNVVALGGTTPFTNEFLGRADNAALIANLVAPRAGTKVVVLTDAVTTGGDGGSADSPFDLVDSSVVQAVAQLGIAFALYALVRGRRLGRPLREPQPVDIAGSELVAAVGDLLQRTGDPDRAARLLRDDTRRLLCERLGLPLSSPVEVVAAAVANRMGADDDRVTTVLSDQPVPTDAALVSLARQIESLRQEILHEHVV